MSWHRPRVLVVVGLVTWVALCLTSETAAHKPTVTSFNYHEDVYPIFAAKCGSCHRAGGVAPMSLLTYREAFPWAVSIKNEILHMAMPPWFAEERYGRFLHRSETVLTAVEMNTIVDWCLGGAPEGEPRPDEDGAAERNQVPPADLEWQMPEPFMLGPDDSEAVHRVSFDLGLEETRFLKSVRLDAGAPNIVRSALIFLQRANGPDEEELVGVWTPGGLAEPSEFGYRLEPGDRMVARLHYKKTWLDDGAPVEDQSSLSLYFHDGAPSFIGTSRRIPSDESMESTSTGFVLRAARAIDEDVALLSLSARVGRRLDSLLVEAVGPEGSRQTLLRLLGPSPDWPRKYWLVAPRNLTQGSRLEVRLFAKEREPLEADHALFVDLVSD